MKVHISRDEVVTIERMLQDPELPIFLVCSEDRITLGKIFKRIQEFYENPTFQNTVFTHEQFDEWYSSHFETTYEEYWDGYNFPGHILQKFKEEFKDIDGYEMTLIDLLDLGLTGNSFYIIGCLKGDTETLSHEVAHAMYFLSLPYRTEVSEILKGIDFSPIEEFLRGRMYAESVLPDEIHSYLMFDRKDLEENGIDLSPYNGISGELLENFIASTPV
jgi:hypothetical protein